MSRRSTYHRVCAVLLVSSLVGLPVFSAEPVELILARSEIPEELLLDVGIRIFDPGLPEEDESAEEDKAIFPELRKSEARFIPFHIKNTLESTGHWGAVRVVPDAAGSADVVIHGTIVQSHGLKLHLLLMMIDSRGKVWKEKVYKREALSQAYDDDELEGVDPYQDLYRLIANDLFRARQKLKERELLEIREVSRLSFAADLAPEIFGDYLETSKKGKVKIVRLPAEDDPMMIRADKIRERDFLFIDTLNEYYANFYLRMDAPYDDWREISYDEQFALRKIKREARTQKILGGLLIVGAAAGGGSSSAARAARSGAAVSGALVLQGGIATGQSAKIHVEALKELAASFDAEMEPLLVEVEGRVMLLEGSAEAQYAEWRRLLGEIFSAETGLTPDTAASQSTPVTIKP